MLLMISPNLERGIMKEDLGTVIPPEGQDRDLTRTIRRKMMRLLCRESWISNEIRPLQVEERMLQSDQLASRVPSVSLYL